ncbi:hypothetical protein BYT27DRAFT_6350544 [Phlegmacium glaucopus]|nr:hypothetical protein BYT27DRAFT_6350544 [Phlegmacium glaucopus]
MYTVNQIFISDHELRLFNTPMQSLLSSLESFQKQDAFPPHAVHPFASTAPDACVLLQELINATDQVSRSLDICDSSIPWTNTKVVSLLRQHSSIEYSAFSSVKNNQHLIDALRERSGIRYGENVPLLLASIPDWCINQLGAWGTSVGMETFVDVRGDGATVVLGGKVLVIDVDFAIERDEQMNRQLKVVNIKTSNALVSGNTNPSASTMLDIFLAGNIQKYCTEMQKTEDSRDPGLAANIRKNILSQLRYLVLLDGLANRKDDGGIRWFTDLDELYPTLNEVARGEAGLVASSLSLPKAPLDIFLLRSHALPLPYLIIPSISFLTYLSPLAYLSLLRDSKGQDMDDSFPLLDLTLSQLRWSLTSLKKGVTIATLSLEILSEAHLYPPSMSMPNVTARPTFPLMPAVSELDHNFPQLGDNFGVAVDFHESNTFPGPYTWVLDFTESGKRPGVVTSQSRMKEIELVVNPLGGIDSLNGVSDMLSFSPTTSWIDLLLNPGATASPEQYTALYKSPNSMHPPLQLRLTTPEEPGFLLERVPVHSMKEVWGILEVVREQCWLNEILLGCTWTTEGSQQPEEENIQDESIPTEADLQAILSGTFTPYRIPVNVTLPSGNTTDNLFGPAELDFPPPSRPKIVMTSPERPPISGLVEITVTHDETKPRGISVEIQGAMGSDLKPADLEEICRRGGTLGLPGRVWANGHGLAA